MNRQQRPLQITQHNVQRSFQGEMAAFLRERRVCEADIVAIQESYQNPSASTTHYPAKASFWLAYYRKKTRTCMFIHKRIPRSAVGVFFNCYEPALSTHSKPVLVPIDNCKEALLPIGLAAA